MLESQRDRAYRAEWLVAQGMSEEEARIEARENQADFRPAFVRGRHRCALEETDEHSTKESTEQAAESVE